MLKLFKKLFRKVEREVKEEIKEVEELIEYEETKLAKFFYSFIRKVFGPIVRKIWIEKVEGLHNIPMEGGCIVASNHESYFDFICFIAASPRKIHYLAAEKFFRSKKSN